MKHLFIVNPAAGKENAHDTIRTALDTLETPVDYEIYLTKAPGDAQSFVKNICADNPNSRFIACGGDGTLSEVLNGAVGFDDAEIGVVPSGTGNDFCRNFGKGI